MKRVLLLLLVVCLALTACGGSDPKKDAKAAFVYSRFLLHVKKPRPVVSRTGVGQEDIQSNG